MSDEWIVGLFHDILEENPDKKDIIQNKLLKLLNYNWNIFRAIQNITRHDDCIPYFDCIWLIKYMKDENKQGGELA